MRQVPQTFYGQFCHEYRAKGDLHTSYGFGDTEAEAREKAVYGPDREGESARDHELGFGDWILRVDREGDQWVKQVNKTVA